MVGEKIKDYSIPELLTCFLSREFEDGLDLSAGAGSPIARGAVMLAALNRCPNIRVGLSEGITNILNVGPVGPFEFECDGRASRWAEMYRTDPEVLLEAKLWLHKKLFFVGAIQVDKYGNCNLIGIGDDIKKLRFRGPGGIATPSATTHVKRYYILVNAHNTRTFVEECDYISQVGWGEGGADARKSLGIPGGGPKYVLTPLCIMDFEESSKRMRLKTIHPGVTVQQVVENTGFELIIPKNVPLTEAPTEQELDFLRNKIDAEGVLRR